MKKVITSIAAAFIMITSFSSFAAEPVHANNNTASNKTLTAYVSSLTEGVVALNDLIYARDFEYRNSANYTDKTYSRKEYMKFLKTNKGLKFDCTTTYQLLDEVGNTSLAKVTMVFKDFTRVDYVTLIANKNQWKISKVVTTYPESGMAK